MNKEIETLYNKLDAYEKIISNQALEIASLNEDITWWSNRFKAVEKENRKLKEQLGDKENE